jgi:hypothetical protein
MSKAKTLATTVSTGGVLDNPSAIPGANISGAVGSATNLAGGSNGTIPYQSASGTTQMLAVGTAGQVLQTNGAGAPTWATPASATTATNIAGGSNGTIPYQSAAGTTQMLAVGTAGQVLQTNGAGAPSWATIQSDGARFTAVASGALTDGRMVNLNDDGTVTMVGETTTVYPDSIPSGSAANYQTRNTRQQSVAFNKSVANQFMICYYDMISSNLKAAVGTVSGSSISFGTAVVVNSNGDPETPDLVHVTGTSDRYVIVWRGSGEDGWSRVASVSGTTISFGSEVTFATSSTYVTTLASGPSSGQIAVLFIDNNNGNYPTVCVGSVSGTSITWGAKSVVDSVNSLGPMALAFDPFSGSRLFAVYRPNDTGYGQSRIGSVSGTSVSSWGTAYPWFSANELSEDYGYRHYAISFDRVTANSFVVAWKNAVTNVNQMKAATHSGGVITYGTAATFDSTSIQGDVSIAMNETIAGSFVLAYSSATTTLARTFTIAGTTITLGTASTVQAGISTSNKVTADEGTARKFVGIYKDNTTNYGYAYTGTIGYSEVTNNLSATKFIGVSDGSYTNGQTATIQTKYGINPDQTGLTTNASYYLQTNGTLSTTPASPSVLAGRALSATKILIGAI